MKVTEKKGRGRGVDVRSCLRLTGIAITLFFTLQPVAFCSPLTGTPLTTSGFGAIVNELGEGKFIISDETQIKVLDMSNGSTVELIPRYFDTRWTDHHDLTFNMDSNDPGYREAAAAKVSGILGKIYVDYGSCGRVAYFKTFSLGNPQGYRKYKHKESFGIGNLYSSRADGSDEQLVAPDFEDYLPLVWSTDGRWVASSNFLYDFKTRRRSPLSSELFNFRFSKDSNFLYGCRFIKQDGDWATLDVVKVNPATGSRQRIYMTPPKFVYNGGNMGLGGRARIECDADGVSLVLTDCIVRISNNGAAKIDLSPPDSKNPYTDTLSPGMRGKVLLKTDPANGQETAYWLDRDSSYQLRAGSVRMKKAYHDGTSGNVLAEGYDANVYLFTTQEGD